jgi:hypothetical protein
MNIYILKTLEEWGNEFVEEFIIIAENETEARLIADQSEFGNGQTWEYSWQNPEYATIIELPLSTKVISSRYGN